MSEITQAPEKAIIQLPPNELNQFDYVSQRFDAEIPVGVPPEALLKPEFWAHQAVKLQPMNEIRARAKDGTWVAYYVVLDCSRTWAKVHQLSFHRLTTADVSLSQSSEVDVKAFMEAHRVVHRGPHKWSIVRKGDGAVIEQGIEQRDAATAELERLARQQVGGAATQKSTPSAVAA